MDLTWMNGLFSTVLNMSLTASVMILLVLAARLLLRRAPKVFSYILWSVVLFRLLCPVSFTAGASVLGLLDAPAKSARPMVSRVEYVPSVPQRVPEAAHQQPAAAITDILENRIPEEMSAKPAVSQVSETKWTLPSVHAGIWGVGVLGMMLYSLFSLLYLQRYLAEAMRLRDNIYLADRIPTAFVLGVIRPRIYLPSFLTEKEQTFILLHEQHHIRRGDMAVKVLFFAALALHWFNPLVWLAYRLAGSDIEMSCDEAVIARLGEEIRAAYSDSLLKLSVGREKYTGMPLAFGEGDPKARIRNLLHWKRPRLWVSIVAAALCVAVVAGCAGNPRATEAAVSAPPSTQERFASVEEYLGYVGQNDSLALPMRSGETKAFPVVEQSLSLQHSASVEDLAPEGTLELWRYFRTFRLDLEDTDRNDLILQEGMSLDGTDCLAQGSEMILIAIRDDDGSYQILAEDDADSVKDVLANYYHDREYLFDWYAEGKGLDASDYPRYAAVWKVTAQTPDGEAALSVPVHRYDGNGWYLYVPVSGWEKAQGEERWSSAAGSDSALTVTRTDSTDELWVENSPFNMVHRRETHEDPRGGCWQIDAVYFSHRVEENSDVQLEPQLLEQMLRSFTLDERLCFTEPEELLAAALQNELGIRYSNEEIPVNEVPVAHPTETEQLLRELTEKDSDLESPAGFTFVDLDQDGQTEAVYRRGDYRGYIVLHAWDEAVYGYDLSYRQMMGLKLDGSFAGSGGADIAFFGHLCFDGPLAWIEGEEWTSVEKPMASGQVTQAQMEQLWQRHENLMNVVWYGMEPEHLEENLHSAMTKPGVETFPLMGLNAWYTEEETVPHHYTRTYYGETPAGPMQLAESFGFALDDYIVDLDGDGVTELVCNCQFGGDGALRVYVFRMGADGVEQGSLQWREADLPDLMLWGVNATGEWYDADTGRFVLNYAAKDGSYRTHRYTWKDFAFEPYTGS